MSDGVTASLRIKYESVGEEQVLRQQAMMKAASVDMVKVMVANSAIVKQATLGDIKIETEARIQAIKIGTQTSFAELKKANAIELGEIQKSTAERVAEIRKRASQEAAASKIAAKGTPQISHIEAWKDQQDLQTAWLKAKDNRANELLSVQKAQNAASFGEFKKNEAEKTAVAVRESKIRYEQQDAHVRAFHANQKKVEAEAAKSSTQKPVATGSSDGLGLLGSLSLYATGLNNVIALTQRFAGVMYDLAENAAVWDSYRIALETMEGGAGKASKAINDLYQIAKAPGIDLEVAEKSYLQFRALNIEGEKAKNMIKVFSNAVALGGGSSVELSRVNVQMRQMLSNNKVLESDLRFMKESMPMLAKVMQDTFGTTTAAGIRAMGLSANEFIDGIMVGLEKLPKAQQNLRSEMENTATAWSLLKASIVDTSYTKSVFAGFTDLFESLTGVVNGASIKWGQLIKDALLGSPFAALGKFAAGGYDDSAETKYFEEKQAKLDRLLELRRGSFSIAKAKEAAAIKEWLSANTVAREAAAAFDADSADTQRKLGLVGPAKKPPPKPPPKEEKKKSFTNPLDQVGDKRYLTVDQLQGRNLLEAQAAIDKALIDEHDKANKDAAKQEEDNYKDEQRKFNANQKVIFENKVEEEKRLDDFDKKHLEALQELREAEAGEYELRLIQITSWGEQMKAQVGNDEAALTRISEVESQKRTLVYADAWSKMLGGSSSFFGSMASLSKQYNEENTREYAKWVAISQGLAIAEATINIAVAMSTALKKGFTTLDGLAQMGVVAAAGGQILNSIASMNAAKVGKGAFDKGGSLGYGEVGIAGENGLEFVQGPARITSTRDTARALAGSGAGKVVINNYANAEVSATQNEDGSIDILVRKVAELTEQNMTAGILQGSSKFGRAAQSVYGLKRRGM